MLPAVPRISGSGGGTSPYALLRAINTTLGSDIHLFLLRPSIQQQKQTHVDGLIGFVEKEAAEACGSANGGAWLQAFEALTPLTPPTAAKQRRVRQPRTGILHAAEKQP